MIVKFEKAIWLVSTEIQYPFLVLYYMLALQKHVHIVQTVKFKADVTVFYV